MLLRNRFLAILAFVLVLIAGCAAPQEVVEVVERPAPPVAEAPAPSPSPEVAEPAPEAPAVEVGRFDTGKMWIFENPPIDYFAEAYGFRPDSAWFARARLGALRFADNCSASFVSPQGLVLTNHHCARESIAEVSREGEDLLENGFYADALAAEREVPELYVDQLLAIDDVTRRIETAARAVRGDDDKAQLISQKISEIEETMTAEAKAQDSTRYVEVVELYDGGRYAAYTFRRYDDVRLVMAPENKLGYFGGDADNFTYPRYSFDMALFRAYGPDGAPLATTNFFPWSSQGVREGEAVFVVGNPGTTDRLATVAELIYERDYELPQQIAALERRAEILRAYLDAREDEEGAAIDALRNTYFSVANSLKASRGQLEGLRDAALIARRAAAETTFRRDLAANDSLGRLYAEAFQDLEELQRSKQAVAPRQAAFTFFGTELGSHVLLRALYGWYYDTLKRRGLPPADLADLREDALEVEDLPAGIERELIALRLAEVRDVLGAADPTVRRILDGASADSVAARIVAGTALLDSTSFAQVFDSGYLGSGDPTVEVMNALAPLFFQLAQSQQNFANRQELLGGELARARLALYGTAVPPDASFSLRIADGVVAGYAYNGTEAPAFTTFFGLYNRHFSYPDDDWRLPERWLSPPAAFDLSTPLNLVTTNDITGGNSGSPLLNQNLELVGLVFDGNIESLPNTYIYLDDAARAIAVDARGILEALDDIYDADRIVLELTTGRLVTTEAEADAASR